jgi:hypothetical protein
MHVHALCEHIGGCPYNVPPLPPPAGALGCLWWSIILPNQGAQRSLFDMMAGYASAVQAKAVLTH